ncbi:uncharacterized protein J8A68_005234 [[Candida] subhashii]|uniref:AB hydrolase-1 domain-containing protein n=1 Tax=[Candida] subhashii TaxID=561895 RepID=A0A8J5QI32_9ASCO|nr:uncharacterized protein J8A68_005234 [[Candida] subhashii]KAG7661238.1 hypothetical protein J8A68_005234 [[Candida] subhashii]
MLLKQHQIKLKNGKRTFTTLSNLTESDVYTNVNKWSRLIILLHGFPDINTTFNPIWSDLDKSFGEEQVLLLAPKLRGYEKSSQGPESEYKLTDIAEDVRVWIETLNPDGKYPVHLLGHDWGAIIAYQTANLFPDLITSMVTLAIPYMADTNAWEFLWNCPEQFYLSSYFLTMQSSIIYLPKLIDKNCKYLGKLWRYWSPTYDFTNDEIQEIGNTFMEEGVADAATSYYRHILKPSTLLKSRWQVDFDKVPTLIMTGDEDGCMSLRLSQSEAAKLKGRTQVEFKILPNSGHFLQRESPEQVARLATEFFEKYRG